MSVSERSVMWKLFIGDNKVGGRCRAAHDYDCMLAARCLPVR